MEGCARALIRFSLKSLFCQISSVLLPRATLCIRFIAVYLFLFYCLILLLLVTIAGLSCKKTNINLNEVVVEAPHSPLFFRSR